MFIFGTRSLDFPVVMFCLGPTPARTFKVSVVGGVGVDFVQGREKL